MLTTTYLLSHQHLKEKQLYIYIKTLFFIHFLFQEFQEEKKMFQG